MAQKEVVLKDLYVLYEVNSSNNIIFANDAFCKISNYTKDEIIGISHQKLKHPQNTNNILKDLSESISNKAFWEGVIKYQTKDENFFWLHTIALKKIEMGKEKVLYIGIKATKDEIREVELNSDGKHQSEDSIKELVTWSDALSVGFAPMDAHHKNLVDLLNRLNSATLSGKGRKAIGKILGELAEYTVYHFGYEEEQMQKYNFSDFEKHKGEHIAFVNQVKDFIKEFESGDVHVDEETLEFLKKWLSNHILKTDKELGGFLSPSKKR